MALTLKNKYGIGQFVYLVHDPEQVPRMVVFLQINPNGLWYGLSLNGEESTHYEIELSKEKALIAPKPEEED
jgi:hypothetical protein